MSDTFRLDTPKAPRPASYGSSRFRQSTHLIPTPELDQKRPPRYEPTVIRPWAVGLLVSINTAVAVALEVALSISKKNHGYAVPKTNALSFVSAQFLLSVIPALLILPLGYLVRCVDWALRWSHPYVILAHGNALAKHTVLLDYIALGVKSSLTTSIKYRHWVVFFSALAASGTFWLQSLSGGIFTLISVETIQELQDGLASVRAVGLADNLNRLTAFVAAAGYADAAVFHGLSDPPFVKDNWAIAEFRFPSETPLNGSVAVNTTGVFTDTNCLNSALPPVLTITSPPNVTLTASSSVDPCNVSVTFDFSSAYQQYGVVDVECAAQDLEPEFRPVMFWYFHNRTDNGKPEARTVFCSPEINVLNINANITLADRSVKAVVPYTNYTPETTVSGAPLFGRAFNGVIFQPSNDDLIEARAKTIRTSLPGSAFRLADQNGLQQAFDDREGFLNLTQRVYMQHLSIVAKSIYFVQSSGTLPTRLGSLAPRLWINPFAAHVLSMLLLLISVVILGTQMVHYRVRKTLYLTCPPGTVAAVTALTAHSGFGELLLPYDDQPTIEQKLEGLRFRLDERTGAILADDYYPPGREPADDDFSLAFPDETEATTSLLHARSPGRMMSFSKAQTALQTAVGYPPRKYTYKTAYDD